MRQDIMMILDTSIGAVEIDSILKDRGYSTLLDKDNIKVWG